MRKLVISLVVVALISAGCLVSPSAGGTATSGSKYDATQDARIVALEGIILGPNGLQSLVGSLNTKIASGGDTAGLSSRISSLETRLATAESKLATAGGGGASTATTDALSARIKTLEDWKATAGTSTGGTPSTPSSGVISSNGNLELVLERPVDDEIWLDNGVSQTWRFTVKNKGTSGTYFRINANFDVVDESVAIASTVLTPDYSASSGMSFTPTTLSGTLSNLAYSSIASSSSTKVYIGKAREESLYVTFKINYSTVSGKRWNWDFTIRELN